ncbi:alkylated DNA repair dioxygenase AlkB [Neisseria sp. HSC-16F19]|nr:alpha-ketoglutarate-dependent dioxygenase AlkB [Neisseria sp. HSC-16F19]MCP2041526.1 alkylated DNA repair dioxygenase AlkB [Neisseria sp. HSC-16F19]
MADLFAQEGDAAVNLLPRDGIVNDYGLIFSTAEADDCFRQLLQEIPWQHDEAVIYGRRIITARQVAWYGDAAFDYHYSGTRRTARPWTPLLLHIKERVEQQLAAVSPTVFNSCLLNLYADGSQGMAWHSDDEACLGRNTVIASVSFGAPRKFALRHKDRSTQCALILAHGQLLVMRGSTQSHWQHALMKSARIHSPRINLTFRTMLNNGM